MNKSHKKSLFTSYDEEASKTYITPNWQQHEELISHVSQFSQNILLIIAPQGGGKTTFLQHFLDKTTPELTKKSFSGHSQTTCEELLKKVALSFNLTWQGSHDLAKQVREAIEENALRSGTTWTLFIDDAHLLSNEQLQALVQLVNFEDEPRKQCRLVLLGEPSLELRLFSPEFTAVSHGKIYTIELESWTLQDVQGYLAKDHFSSQLSKDQIALIYERSRGLPGYVIREVNDALEHLTTTGKKMNKRKFKLWGFHPISFGILAGLVMGGSYLLLNNNGDEEGTSTPVNAAQQAENTWGANEISPKKTSPSVAFHFDKVDTSDIVEDDMIQEQNTSPENIKHENAVSDKTMAPKSALEMQKTSLTKAPKIDEPKVQIEQVAKAEVKAQTQIQPQAQVQAKEKVKAQKEYAKKSLSDEESYLLSVDKHHYTLQLLGASKESSINAFIKKHGIEEKAHAFHTKRQGKDWYVVVYGNYSSAQEAKTAANAIPSSLKNANVQPWVRELNAVHQDINQKG